DVPSSDTAGIAEESSDVENKAPTDVFLDDLSPDPPKVKLELEKCGVYSRKLADPLLRDTYPDRPHLPGDKHNVSWKEATSDTEGHDLGMVKLSKVIEMMPNLSTEYIQKLVSVSFDKKTNVVNLSSVNPAELVYKRLSAASPTTPYKHLFLRGETHPVLCFTLLCSDEDYTKSLKSNNGPFASKLLTGTPLSLEYERMVSTLCYAMDDVEFIRTQIVENRWSFGTRPVRNDGQDNSAKGTPRRRSKMTAPTASPATVLTKSNSTDIWRTQIAANDDIPVFDGRFKQITLPKGIRTVPKDFPPFKGEIPFDSFILVAYTTMGYAAAKFKEDTSVAFNALWALVLSAGEDPYVFPRTFFHDDDLFRMLEATFPLSIPSPDFTLLNQRGQ
ncbi:hypothetical protein CPB83DRAFT_932332, partial [Crepidotus variabilis]